MGPSRSQLEPLQVLDSLPELPPVSQESRSERAPTHSFQLTSLGWGFLLLTLSVAAVAWSSANSLLFGFLSLLLALLMVELLLGSWNLRALRVRRRLPPELFAGRPALGAVLLENPRRFLDSWSIRIDERPGPDPLVQHRPSELARLPQRSEGLVPFTWRFGRRGWSSLNEIVLSSTYPFGFVRRSRRLFAPAELLVWPAPGPLRESGIEAAPGIQRADSGQVGGTGELYELRPYIPGDPPGRIHWPASARSQTWMTAQREQERNDELMLRLPAERDPDRWEKAIRGACAQILENTRQGRAVGLEIAGQGRYQPEPGEPQRRRLLGILALLPPQWGAPE